MNYRSRAELELIGKTGAYSYNDRLDDGTDCKISRLLSSYWICTKTIGRDIAENLMKDGYWESWVTLWISNHVAPGSVCIDAGANYGYYSFFLAQHGCRVISIEANSDLMRYLQKSVSVNGCADRVRILNKAITDTSWQTIDLNVLEAEIGGASIFSREDARKVPVETITLNDLLIAEPRIDFLKMDIEGAEEQAWKGMQKLFERNRQFIALMEFSPICYQNSGRDFFSQLKKDFVVSFVDVDGKDKPVADFSFFERNLGEFQMLVIRNRN